MAEREGFGELLATLRRGGPALAWIVAVVTGFQNLAHTDLLDTVLRAAATWLGTWMIWLFGLGLMEKIAGGEPVVSSPADTPETPETK